MYPGGSHCYGPGILISCLLILFPCFVDFCVGGLVLLCCRTSVLYIDFMFYLENIFPFSAVSCSTSSVDLLSCVSLFFQCIDVDIVSTLGHSMHILYTYMCSVLMNEESGSSQDSNILTAPSGYFQCNLQKQNS